VKVLAEPNQWIRRNQEDPERPFAYNVHSQKTKVYPILLTIILTGLL